MIAGCNVILDTWHVSVTRDTNMLSSDWSVVTVLWSLIGPYTGAWRSHVRKKISLNDSFVSRKAGPGSCSIWGHLNSFSLLRDFLY